MELQAKAKNKQIMSRNTKRLIFYILMIAWPVLQFMFFWLYVNIDSIKMSFEVYSIDATTGAMVKGYTLDNIVTAWKFFIHNGQMLKNSAIIYFVRHIVGLLLSLIFSFYIYKKNSCSGFFKIILFLPNIVAGVIFALLYKFITTDVYQYLTDVSNVALLVNPDTRLGAVVFYNLWVSFGTLVIMFTGSMSGINDSIVESAELDGVNYIQEMIYITIPCVFPNIVAFTVAGIADFFINQMGLYNFYGDTATPDLQTFGYYMYVAQFKGDLMTDSIYMNYPQLAALGVIFTLIVTPITLGVRKLMETFGPSVE